MLERVAAFVGTIAEKENRLFVKDFGEGVFVDDDGICWHHFMEGTVVNRGVDFHASGVDHRAEQRVVGDVFSVEQNRGAEHFERGDADEFQVSAIAQAFCC